MNYQNERNRISAADDSGKIIAEITFPEARDGVFVIDHTFVDDCLRGQGVAGTLVSMAVRHIKEQGGTVEATCPYAVKWLEKHPEER